MKKIDTQDLTIDDHEISEDDGNNSDDDTVYDKNIETSSFLPESKNESLEVNAIHRNLGDCKINWPSIDKEPLNEYSTPFLATLAFPTVFPDGLGDPANPSLERDLSFGSRRQHLIKFAENIDGKWVYCFALHPRFS